MGCWDISLYGSVLVGEGQAGLPVSLLSQALVFILLFFLETLHGVHGMELCLCVKCDGDLL